MKTINFQTVRHETPSCKTITHMYVRDTYNVTQTIEVMKHGIFKSINVSIRKGDVIEFLDSSSNILDTLTKEFVCYKINNNITD